MSLAAEYDVIVIGGGINGAGIAREAACAGYRVLLVEKEDFGWGTTWRSTKLIHGGLRYLEHAEFGLVFEALRDQKALLARYPQMIRPMSFLLPMYKGDRHGVPAIELGLKMYDALSLGRSLPSHRRYSAASALELEPALQPAGLKGAFTYSDCQVPYPERLCLQTVIEAREAGATILNHTEVIGFAQRSGRIEGVIMRPGAGGPQIEVGAAIVVNAAGPWVDEVLGEFSRPAARAIGGTKGAHIVVDYGGGGPLHAIYAEAQVDHRPFFIVPWRGRHLIGTTDTHFEGSPDRVRAEQSDITYLLDQANRLLPNAKLNTGNVLYGYAGVRPLAASAGLSEGAITRRHVIRDHGLEGHDGLLSIIGGKLSTYLSLSSQTLARIRISLKSPAPGSAVERGIRDRCPPKSQSASATAEACALLPGQLDYLRSLYGPRSGCLLQLIAEDRSLMRPLCAHGPDVEAQVVLAVRDEQAATLSDVLFRRTGAAWNLCRGLDSAPVVAALMARELAWTPARVADELVKYALEVEQTFTLPTGQATAHKSLAL